MNRVSNNVSDAPASHQSNKTTSARQALITTAFATLSLGVALYLSRHYSVWLTTGTAAAATLIIVLRFARFNWRAALVPRKRDLIFGLLMGVIMVCLTHWVYPLASGWFPAIDQEALLLYRSLQGRPGTPGAIPILLLVVFVEEVIWRGVLFQFLRQRFATLPVASMVSLAAYALPQVGSSWLTLLLALCCGAIWTTQRAITGRLSASLLTHAIWSGSVLVLLPVTAP